MSSSKKFNIHLDFSQKSAYVSRQKAITLLILKLDAKKSLISSKTERLLLVVRKIQISTNTYNKNFLWVQDYQNEVHGYVPHYIYALNKVTTSQDKGLSTLQNDDYDVTRDRKNKTFQTLGKNNIKKNRESRVDIQYIIIYTIKFYL